MKPNFALNLSFEGIGLLHRAGNGWHLVGEVALDSADLAGELAVLRDKAGLLDPAGQNSKLIIPNQQIKYLEIQLNPEAGDDLIGAVRAALAGATPYAIEDLAYDWSIRGKTVYIAAVARETLNEAESFVRDHRFAPVSFVAMPEDGQFVGEPFFGPVPAPGALADAGQQVERDKEAVRILGAAHLPVPEEEADADADAVAAGAEEPIAKTAESVPESASQDDTASDTSVPLPLAEAPPAVKEAPEERDATGIAFASIRARRDVPKASPDAPKLVGAARKEAPESGPAKAPLVAVEDVPAPRISDVIAALSEETALPENQPEFGAAPEIRLSTTGSEEEDIPPAPGFSTRRAPDAVEPATPRDRAAKNTKDEARRMTVFGAREPAKVGGKPKFLGLFLTVALLLFLVGIAAWASIFMDEGISRFFGEPAKTKIVDVPAPEPDAEVGAVPEATQDPEAAADEIVVASLPPGDGAEDEPAQAGMLLQPAPAELSPDEARTRYAATGIWQMAPEAPVAPTVVGLEDVYQASIDHQISAHDAVALPRPGDALADARPDTPPDPAAPGTQFDFDARGLVVATPEGALTPDGLRVFAGRPALTPGVVPDRPGDVAVALAATPDPALAALRPKLRPESLVEQNERGNLSGRSREELAALRPRLRPQSAQEAAENTAIAAAVAAAAAETGLGGAEGAQRASLYTPAMPQAVTASVKPNARPSRLEKRIERNQSSAIAQPVSAAQKMAPRIPTTANVAKRATERNAIKLRRVNLIGVYGTPKSRRALVRLSNGRYKKVKVGDRLDGGRVLAIGDSELNYKKGGRSVVLRMPKG